MNEKRTNQVTEYIANTDSISFLASFGYKVLGVDKQNNRDYDEYTLINENKSLARPFRLRRKDFLRFIHKKYHKSVKVVKTQRMQSLNACVDYDLFNWPDGGSTPPVCT